MVLSNWVHGLGTRHVALLCWFSGMHFSFQWDLRFEMMLRLRSGVEHAFGVHQQLHFQFTV